MGAPPKIGRSPGGEPPKDHPTALRGNADMLAARARKEAKEAEARAALEAEIAERVAELPESLRQRASVRRSVRNQVMVERAFDAAYERVLGGDSTAAHFKAFSDSSRTLLEQTNVMLNRLIESDGASGSATQKVYASTLDWIAAQDSKPVEIIEDRSVEPGRCPDCQGPLSEPSRPRLCAQGVHMQSVTGNGASITVPPASITITAADGIKGPVHPAAICTHVHILRTEPEGLPLKCLDCGASLR